MITIKRLTSSLEVVENWPYFTQGLQAIAAKHKDDLDLEMMFKVFCVLVTSPWNAWVGLAMVDGKVEGFAAFEEATPMFAKQRSFIARAFYHKPGNKAATLAMMNGFEDWAKTQNIKMYIVTTRRGTSGAAREFFGNLGFSIGYVTFERKLN